DDGNLCAAAPRFAYGGGATIAGAARAAANAIAHDLFGPVVHSEAAPNSMRCQKQVSREAGKLAVQRWMELWKCQRRTMADCDDGADLARVCLGGPGGPQPDPRGTLSAREHMLAEKSQRLCADVGVSFNVFSGTCGNHTSVAEFSNCVVSRI